MSAMQGNKKAPRDWDKEDIIAAVHKTGWSLRQLSIAHGLSPWTVQSALNRPYLKCEQIIADAIGVSPEEIWPTRYAKRNFRPTLKV